MSGLEVVAVAIAAVRVITFMLESAEQTMKNVTQMSQTVKMLDIALTEVHSRLVTGGEQEEKTKLIVSYLGSINKLLDDAKKLLEDQIKKIKSNSIMTKARMLFETSTIDRVNASLQTATEHLKLLLTVQDPAHYNVDRHIDEIDGRQFWKNYFGAQVDMRPWKSFLAAFESYYMKNCGSGYFNDEIKKHLKQAVDYTNDDEVTAFEFDAYLKWFGPLNGSVERMMNLYRQPYWHGTISREVAIGYLDGQRPGTFLVRNSRLPGQFAVSFVAPDNVVRHALIINLPNHRFAFEPNSQSFASMPELVEAHSNGLSIPYRGEYTPDVDSSSPAASVYSSFNDSFRLK